MKKNINRLLAVLLACFMSFQSIPAFHARAVDEEATQEAVMPADRQSEKTEEETEVSPEDPAEATTEKTDDTQENPVEVKTEETEISPENPVEETTEKLEALHPLILDVLPVNFEELFIYEHEGGRK